MRAALCLVFAGCVTFEPAPVPGDEPPREHHERFAGLWIVEQPFHALYESTLYRFQPDGSVIVGDSFPNDCSGHLREHCVTGSVAHCVPPAGYQRCTSDLTCVFGSTWWSIGSTQLYISGDCSDGIERAIRIDMAEDSSQNTSGGANAMLVSVDGDPAWSHDNWDWAFRRCTTESECSMF